MEEYNWTKGTLKIDFFIYKAYMDDFDACCATLWIELCLSTAFSGRLPNQKRSAIYRSEKNSQNCKDEWRMEE